MTLANLFKRSPDESNLPAERREQKSHTGPGTSLPRRLTHEICATDGKRGEARKILRIEVQSPTISSPHLMKGLARLHLEDVELLSVALAVFHPLGCTTRQLTSAGRKDRDSLNVKTS